MDENQDCREEIINKLAVWATSGIDDVREAKCDLYLLLSDVEITSRHTKVFSVQEDRNEYLLENFLLAKQVKGCTDKTLKSYARNIKITLKQIEKTADDITAEDIRCYIAFRLKDKISKATIAGEIAILSSFFNWLYTEEIIKRNPMSKVDKIKTEKIKKKAFTELEIEKLRLATENAREQTIVEMLLSTGCRVTELTEILLADIEGSKILVRGKGAKERYVYLNAKAQLALEQYLSERKDDNPFLFPKGKLFNKWNKKGMSKKIMKDWWKDPEKMEKDEHVDKASIEKVVVRIAKRAGIDKANPHKFRRTCATMALKRGMPLLQVSKMLGHESTETTQIYLDLSDDDLAQAHKKYVV